MVDIPIQLDAIRITVPCYITNQEYTCEFEEYYYKIFDSGKEMRFHFIRDVVENRAIKVEKVITDDNVADMLTKIVPLAKFAHCNDLAGVCIN